MGFAERLSSSCSTSNLEHREENVMPVDLVAAMSGASDLGADMFRATDGDVAALRRAVKVLSLADVRRFRAGRKYSFELALAAIQEVIMCKCEKCNGAGQVVVAKLKVVCDKCSGTGTKRWLDEERAELIGVPTEIYKKIEKRYVKAVDTASLAYTGTVGLARKRLG